MKTTPINASQSAWLACIAMFAAIGVTWLSYMPGLDGSFLFDDYANLPQLGAYGPVDNATAFWRYITSGFADPIGRPLSLLSFLIDARDWPADPEPFKRTNIALHLLNGILLWWLLTKLARRMDVSALRARWIAMLGTSFWLLHPLWISTTLYVIQREAILPATFVLLGLLAYLHGRDRIVAAPVRGGIWIVAGVGGCTVLAALSKANGLLLPLLTVVLEITYLRTLSGVERSFPRLRRILWISIYPAALAVCAYLAFMTVQGFAHGAPVYRPWTYGQRLLTEPRVIVDYLYLLVIPRPYSRGLFNDDFVTSIDLFHPWTTLPCLVLLTGLIYVAIRWHKSHPPLTLAIAFFFVAHLMESGPVPLELYFEHRNYLPAMLLFFPLAVWLTDSRKLQRLKVVVAAMALCILSVETNAAARLWGDPQIQALIWAKQNPNSPRAQTYASAAERSVGEFSQAEARLRTSLSTHPDEIQLAINLLGVRCEIGSVSPGDIATAERALRTGSQRGPLTFDWIVEAIAIVKKGSCAGLSSQTLQQLVHATWENSQASRSANLRQNLLDLEGQLALANGNAAEATEKFRESLALEITPDVALKQAALLGSYGLPKAGLAQLNFYRSEAAAENHPMNDMKSLHLWLLQHDGYWDNELHHMRQVLENDAAQPATVHEQ